MKKKFDIRFVDSYKFIMASLDKLVGNLNDFPIISENFPEESRELLLRKGVFPYDWFNSLERFNETQLPSKEEFYSNLSDSDITDDDFVHAQKVWEHFGMKTSENIMICISRQTFFFLQMFLKISGTFV